MKNRTIGFIGLGIMGLPMARRLVRAGYGLIGYDIEPDRLSSLESEGGRKGSSPKDVAEKADIVISMLSGPTVTRKVILGNGGAGAGFRAGTIYLDMSTSRPSLTREIDAALGKKQVKMLDAPVSGGEKGAMEGSLAIMVGGDRDVFETACPVLECMGKQVLYVGPIGAGHTVKLINNMLFAVNMAATCEAMALGKKAGIDPVILRQVMKNSSGRSYALDIKVRDFVFPRDFTPGFTVDLQNKDMDLALGLAQELGVPVLLGNLVRQLYQTLAVRGVGQKDTSVLVSLFEELMACGEIRGEGKIL